MKLAAAVVLLALSAGAHGQVQTLRRASIQAGTVQRGDMPASLRGQGVVGTGKTTTLSVPHALAMGVRSGQAVALHTERGDLRGRVSDTGPTASDGVMQVAVVLDSGRPESIPAGTAVQGTIEIATLRDVTFVERPVSCRPESEGVVFKIGPDGKTATRVRVRYGKYGHTPATVVEIREGLLPGDKIILSDMSSYAAQEQVRLE